MKRKAFLVVNTIIIISGFLVLAACMGMLFYHPCKDCLLCTTICADGIVLAVCGRDGV